jgi:hypothetical protein
MAFKGIDQGRESIELDSAQRPDFPKPFYRFLFDRAYLHAPAWCWAAAILLAFCFPLSWLLSMRSHLPESDVYASLTAFAIIFGLWALNRMYVRTLQVVDRIEHMLSNRNMGRLKDAFCMVYANRLLIPAGLAFAVFVVVQWEYFGLRLPTVLSLYVGVLIFVAGFVGGLGLWEAVATMAMVNIMLPTDDDWYFNLAPARSTVVGEVSGLFLEYSMVFAVEVLPFPIGFAIFSGSTPALAAMGKLKANTWMLTTSGVLILLIFLVIMPLYFVMPQLIVRSNVKRVKAKFARQYQGRLNALMSQSDERMTLRDIREFNFLRDAESELHKSPSFPLGFTDMAKPFLPLLPSIGTLLASDAIMKSLTQTLKHVFPWL